MTAATTLAANVGVSFQGTSKVGPFEVDAETALAWLRLPNANGASNAEVVKPWVNGMDLTRRPSNTWIVDFGPTMPESVAAMFEAPFEHVLAKVKPERLNNNREAYGRYWWRHAEARSGMRAALSACTRFIGTPRVSKHRVFAWLPATTLADTAVVVACRADDTTFGLLHSRFHELWSLRMGTSLEDRPRYTPTTCFETFPFPAGLTPADTAHQRIKPIAGGASIPADLAPPIRDHAGAIARAAKRLTDLRDAWLNPPEWTERVREVVPLGMSKSPYPDRIVAKPGFEKEVAQRTLTNLYNQRPAWLAQAHGALDVAVAAAYGWADYSPAIPEEEILRRLLALNLGRSG